MAENDFKIASGVITPIPPSIATDAEFAAGTSTTASPTVKQARTGFMDTTGNQTIAGSKTFLGEPRRMSTTIDINTASTTYIANNGWRFVDKNGNVTGYVENSMLAGGSITTALHVRNKDGYQTNLGIVAPFEGTSGAYATAPTPSIASNGNVIATTVWCNTKHQVVSVLPASPDTNIFYYIPE